MDGTSWLRQGEKPLFEGVLWSRPENRRFAGKLLIIGGHRQSFNAVSETYAAALKASIGTARVILPQSLQSMLRALFPEAEFAPSNNIGSFSRDALATWLEAAEWADGVLLAGDFGRNSETAVLLEDFLEKYEGLVVITGDAADYFQRSGGKLKQRYNSVITIGIGRLQKLALPDTAIRQGDDLAQMVSKVCEFTGVVNADFITFHSGNIIVASGGKVSTTPAKTFDEAAAAAYAAVWLIQQASKPFEALTSAAYCYSCDQK